MVATQATQRNTTHNTDITTRVVKADFLKAVKEANKGCFKRLLFVVNKMNDCFKMHLTSVRLRASKFMTEIPVHHGINRRFA